MAGGTRKRGIITEINVTPLVDITLVLLVIFMLTAHLIAKQAIEIELPKAAQGATTAPTTLAVTLTRDGALHLNGQPVTSLADVTRILEDARTKKEEFVVLQLGRGYVEALNREEADQAHPQILKTNGIPKDRNL